MDNNLGPSLGEVINRQINREQMFLDFSVAVHKYLIDNQLDKLKIGQPVIVLMENFKEVGIGLLANIEAKFSTHPCLTIDIKSMNPTIGDVTYSVIYNRDTKQFDIINSKIFPYTDATRTLYIK